MEKTINLKADDVKSGFCRLVLQKKFDATDLKIIAERECSPMPSMRMIAIRAGVDVATISRRVSRIKALVTRSLDANKDLRAL